MRAVKTLTLSDFLRARINEETAAAWAVKSCPLRWSGTTWDHTGEPFNVPFLNDRFDATRLMAEAEAKLRIVEDCVESQYRWILHTLALPYASHPDYDPEWTP